MKREYLPLGSLPAWLRLNGVVSNDVAIQQLGSSESGTDKGNAIVVTAQKTSHESDAQPQVLLQVPSDLVLSLDTVHDYSKSDRELREVLEAVDDFGRTARGAILIFLLVQMTHTSPEIPRNVGVSSPWTEYIKFLPPHFPLPTCYSAEERELLRGSSLAAAVESKVNSLEREFENLRQATQHIAWCHECWWEEGTGKLTFEDWKYVDAAYRSRMVDLPGSGHAMVPGIDMANHASGQNVKALYERDPEGNVVLQLRWGQSLKPGEEVTISYGDEKSASEMIFSYGFLENDRTEAKQALLDMTMPDDDPLGAAKNMVCQDVPGIRISTLHHTSQDSQRTAWDSPIVWWASVNEEDGLKIGLTQTLNGTRELETFWKGQRVQSPGQLRDLLAAEPSWDIFQLRAVVLVLERLETQLSLLEETDQVLSNVRQNEALFNALFRPEIFDLTARLRKLEAELLQKAVEDLSKQRNDLLQSEAVSTYLAQQSQTDEVEDFS